MKIILTALLFAGTFLASATSNAQGKTGHINMQELVMLMPEYKVARAKLDSMEKDMSAILKATQSEFQSKYADYQAKSSTWSEYMRSAKEKELQDLQNRLQTLSEDAQNTISSENEKLMTPIVKKAKEIVAQVAKETGYVNVIDNSSNVLVVSNPADDLLPVVMKKLGIPATDLTNLRKSMEAAPESSPVSPR